MRRNDGCLYAKYGEHTTGTFDNLRLCHLSFCAWYDHTHHKHSLFACTQDQHSMCKSHSRCNLNSFEREKRRKKWFFFIICMFIWFATSRFKIATMNEQSKQSATAIMAEKVTIHNSLWCQKWFISLRVDFMLVWIVFVWDTFMNLLNRRHEAAFLRARIKASHLVFWSFFQFDAVSNYSSVTGDK